MPEELVTQFKETFNDSPAGKIAIVTMDNGEDYRKPNSFGPGGMASLNACLDRVAAEPDVKALILTGKPFIFGAGADLTHGAGSEDLRARPWRSRNGACRLQAPHGPALPDRGRHQRCRPGRGAGDSAGMRLPHHLPRRRRGGLPRVLPGARPGMGRHHPAAQAHRPREGAGDHHPQRPQQQPHDQRQEGLRAGHRRPHLRAGRFPRQDRRVHRGPAAGHGEGGEDRARLVQPGRPGGAGQGRGRLQGARQLQGPLHGHRQHRRGQGQHGGRGIRPGGRGPGHAHPLAPDAGGGLRLRPHPAPGQEAGGRARGRSPAGAARWASWAPGSWAASWRCSSCAA